MWSNKSVRLPACEPFYLRLGEEESVGLFSYDFDDPNSTMRLLAYHQVVGSWQQFSTPVTIPAVDFDAHLTCISANSQPAHAHLTFRRHKDRWRIQAVSDDLAVR